MTGCVAASEGWVTDQVTAHLVHQGNEGGTVRAPLHPDVAAVLDMCDNDFLQRYFLDFRELSAVRILFYCLQEGEYKLLIL